MYAALELCVVCPLAKSTMLAHREEAGGRGLTSRETRDSGCSIKLKTPKRGQQHGGLYVGKSRTYTAIITLDAGLLFRPKKQRALSSLHYIIFQASSRRYFEYETNTEDFYRSVSLRRTFVTHFFSLILFFKKSRS